MSWWRLVSSHRTQPPNTTRPFSVRPLCSKQHHGGKLSQQSERLGAVCRMAANGKWPSRLRRAKTNYLELLAAFIALKHVLPFLQHCHILIRPDSSTTIPYITHQRGGCSLPSQAAAQQNAWDGTVRVTVHVSRLCSVELEKLKVTTSAFMTNGQQSRRIALLQCTRWLTGSLLALY